MVPRARNVMDHRGRRLAACAVSERGRRGVLAVLGDIALDGAVARRGSPARSRRFPIPVPESP